MKKISTVRGISVLSIALWFGIISCNKNPNAASEQGLSSDPAQANLASADQQPVPPALPSQAPNPPARSGNVQRPPAYAPAPSYNSQPDTSQAPPPQPAYQAQPEPAPVAQGYEQNYAGYDQDTNSGEQPVEAEQPPPPLPQYDQPPCPGDNYLWTPGYWSYASAGYYWVPGAWVVAPYVGALWTPPYWGYAGSRYRWYHGYWGPHIGFYGGVNYGFGYNGRGYEGGYWDRNRRTFNYNRSVNNVNTTVIRNVYNYRVVNNNNVRISYNGGRGGINERPSRGEMAVFHEQRIAPVPAQVQDMRQAAANRAQFAAVNHGRPEVLAAPRPLATAYREPAPHPLAVPGARALPQVREQPQPNARPSQVLNPADRSTAFQSRPENRSVPQPQMEQRSAPQPRVEQQRPVSQPRTEQPSRVEQRPTPQPQMEQRSAPQPRVEQQRPVSQPRTEQQPRVEQRPTPQPQMEQRPVPQPRVEQQRPVPQPRTEQQPRIEQRPTPQPQMEQRPAPQPRVEQPRPAPPARPEPAAPVARPSSKPNPPHGEDHEHHS